MPRLTKSDPKLCDYPGRLGKSCVYLPDPDAPRPRRISIPFPKNSREARRQYREIIADWERRGYRPPPREGQEKELAEVTTKEMLAIVFERVIRPDWRNRHGEPNSSALNASYVIGHVAPLDDLPAGSVRKDDLRPIRDAMRDQLELCRSTINNRLQMIGRIWNEAASEGVITAADAAEVKLAADSLKIKKRDLRVKAEREVKAVPVEDFEATLPHVSRRIADILRLERHTRGRTGEIRTLKRGEIETAMIDGKPVMFSRRDHTDADGYKTSDRGHVRTIYFNAEAQAILEPYLDRPDDAYLFSPAEQVAEDNAARRAARKTPLNQGNRKGYNARTRSKAKPKKQPGHCYERAVIGRAVADACKKHGIPRWSPHQLRHLKAGELVEQHGKHVVLQSLGQRSSSMVDRYARDSDRDHQAALAAMASEAA